MRKTCLLAGLALAACLALPVPSDAACCYFSAKNADILQPAQTVLLSWDPVKDVQTFSVQRKSEGTAIACGMVSPTPTWRRLHASRRAFFSRRVVYTILKRREFPHWKLLHILEPPPPFQRFPPG